MQSNESQFRITYQPIDMEEVRGKIIFQQIKEGLEVVIRDQGGVTTTPESIQKVVNSAFEALRIAKVISPETSSYIELALSGSLGRAYMDIAMRGGQQMIDDETQSQVGAMLHELIENLEEDQHISLGNNNETIPHIAEFLFTGQSRMSRFKWLHHKSFNQNEEDWHVKSWQTLLKTVLPGETEANPDQLFEKLIEKRNLPEEEKIKIIQSAIHSAQALKKEVQNL